MVSADIRKTFKRYRSGMLAVGFSTALMVALALPFLAGSNHTCPVLKERQGGSSSAQAVPAFARKYNVDCTYCHTVWPQLNRTGLEFRYLGYRMPYEVPTVPGAKKRSSRSTSGPVTSGGQSPTGVTPGSGAAKQPPTQAMIESGKKIANQMQCLTCHVDGGNIINPNKPIKGAGFQSKYTDDAQIASLIRHGVSGTAMPAYNSDRLSDDQLSDLIAYIRSLKSP